MEPWHLSSPGWLCSPSAAVRLLVGCFLPEVVPWPSLSVFQHQSLDTQNLFDWVDSAGVDLESHPNFEYLDLRHLSWCGTRLTLWDSWGECIYFVCEKDVKKEKKKAKGMNLGVGCVRWMLWPSQISQFWKKLVCPDFLRTKTLTHADSESCYLLGRAVTVAEGWGFFPGVCFLAGMGFWQGSCLWVIRVPISCPSSLLH